MWLWFDSTKFGNTKIDLPYTFRFKQKGNNFWTTWQFFLSFLRWVSHPLKGCWWPPIVWEDDQVTAWITLWFSQFLLVLPDASKHQKWESNWTPKTYTQNAKPQQVCGRLGFPGHTNSLDQLWVKCCIAFTTMVAVAFSFSTEAFGTHGGCVRIQGWVRRKDWIERRWIPVCQFLKFHLVWCIFLGGKSTGINYTSNSF